MKIKVSHESPLSMLDASLKYNDYCYALVHLFESHPEYFNFFQKARELYNKEVYLDNSIFELGETFDPGEYSKWIDKLQPNLYIVPDVLEDTSGTVNAYIDFVKKYPDLPGKKMGVVQGQSYADLVACYKFMSEHADMIAISFDYSYYVLAGLGNNKLERYANGRQRFIQNLIDENIWDWNKPVHLLGCALAREFKYYHERNIFNIKSCDTSNPIMSGIFKLPYNDEWGLDEKPTQKLADLIETTLDEDQLDITLYNLNMFKKILGRDDLLESWE